ncbi:unnamed protein product [Rotaria sp. Silwood1]|nr:unnamed protein product [Rotaria sp. Silwood1]
MGCNVDNYQAYLNTRASQSSSLVLENIVHDLEAAITARGIRIKQSKGGNFHMTLATVKYQYPSDCIVSQLKQKFIPLSNYFGSKKVAQLYDIFTPEKDLNNFETFWLYNESDMCRWWYAPEMIISPEHCNKKVDIWSVGCIMAELIVRQPLFPGTSQSDQLTKIFDITGTPDSKTLDEMNMPLGVRQYFETLSLKPKQDYEKLFGYKYNQDSETPVSGVSSQGVILLDRLLSLNHCMRPTAEELLS